MVEDFNVSLAGRIASARKVSGKTQQQIADALSIHVNQYQRLEAGKHRVSAYDLTRIAAAIGISAGDLLTGPPAPQNHGLGMREPLDQDIPDADKALLQRLAETHPDDIAVEAFSIAMKAKLAKKRNEGRGGWQDKTLCSAEYLSHLLREHVEKGDPIDVANLAMMLHQRGERITPSPSTREVGSK